MLLVAFHFLAQVFKELALALAEGMLTDSLLEGWVK
jgi:hypothetical protein